MIRLFAAIEIPEEDGLALQRRQQGIPGARWRPLDALHLTLSFFGEVSESTAVDLDTGLSNVGGEPLEITLEGVGAFGEGEDVRAVWAGVAPNAGLERLAARCASVARRTGLKLEHRAYRPHVTLAYLRHPDPHKVATWIQTHNLLKSPPIRVTWFGLYSSWLSDEGSRYQLEREYPLIG